MLFDLLFLIFLVILLLSTITCSVFCFKVVSQLNTFKKDLNTVSRELITFKKDLNTVSRELITLNRNTK